jgi:membrane protease YdiL (CAAX protease family)
MRFSKSIKTFFALVLVYAVLASLYVFLPNISALPISNQGLPASKIVISLVSFVSVLVIYGGLGYLGLILSRKIDFAAIWDKKVTNKERFIIPAIVGVVIGVLFITVDILISPLTSFGRFPHPAFPASLIASITAGIGEEIMFRLFFISFWVWLISHVILKQRGKNVVFWVVAVCSALAFSAGHLPSIMVLKGFTNISQIPPLTLVEIFLLNSAVSIPSACYFKKYGILAAMGIHFWTDIVWHVIYGLVVISQS